MSKETVYRCDNINCRKEISYEQTFNRPKLKTNFCIALVGFQNTEDGTTSDLCNVCQYNVLKELLDTLEPA